MVLNSIVKIILFLKGEKGCPMDILLSWTRLSVCTPSLSHTLISEVTGKFPQDPHYLQTNQQIFHIQMGICMSKSKFPDPLLGSRGTGGAIQSK